MKVKISQQHVSSAKREEGSVVVKAAASVVVAGVLFAAAVEGAVLVNTYKKEQLYDQVMAMENQVWSYYREHGRWPGDCNQDGVIGYQPPTTPGVEEYSAQTCSAQGIESFTNALADLEQQLDRSLAKKAAQGEVQIGHGEIAGHKSNAIISYEVPLEVAQWLDTRIDGQESASQGRLRIWGEQASDWGQLEKATVSIAYYFEKSLPNS